MRDARRLPERPPCAVRRLQLVSVRQDEAVGESAPSAHSRDAAQAPATRRTRSRELPEERADVRVRVAVSSKFALNVLTMRSAMRGLSVTYRRSAWKHVSLVEQLEADVRRDLRDERCLDVEGAGERGDVLRHAAEVFVERHEARVLDVRRGARADECLALDEEDERRLKTAVALADKDVDDVIAPGKQREHRIHRRGRPSASGRRGGRPCRGSAGR